MRVHAPKECVKKPIQNGISPDTSKTGQKMFGEMSVIDVLTELVQIDTKEVLDPMYTSKLTEEQKKAALNAITLIKGKTMWSDQRLCRY